MHFNQFLYDINQEILFTNIDRNIIQEYLRELALNGLSGKSIQRKVSSIKSFYNFLAYDMKNENNIADLLSIPKTSKKLPYVLSIKEVIGFLF